MLRNFAKKNCNTLCQIWFSTYFCPICQFWPQFLLKFAYLTWLFSILKKNYKYTPKNSLIMSDSYPNVKENKKYSSICFLYHVGGKMFWFLFCLNKCHKDIGRKWILHRVLITGKIVKQFIALKLKKVFENISYASHRPPIWTALLEFLLLKTS